MYACREREREGEGGRDRDTECDIHILEMDLYKELLGLIGEQVHEDKSFKNFVKFQEFELISKIYV